MLDHYNTDEAGYQGNALQSTRQEKMQDSAQDIDENGLSWYNGNINQEVQVWSVTSRLLRSRTGC